MADSAHDTLLALTADIVTSHVANNNVSVSDVPTLIAAVHKSLSNLGQPVEEPVAELKPAVPIRSSVKPEYLVCLEDGKKLTMLKRYLRTNFDMSPEDYRAKWNLPKDYPMVAPAYADKRRDLAHKIGLGRKARNVAEAVVEAVKPTRKPRAKKADVEAVGEE